MKHKSRRTDQLLTHRIHTRVSQKKYDELTGILNQSRGIRSHSELLRYILDNQEIQLRVYDATFDKMLEELSSIRTQLRGIALNVNQVTRKFHSADHEFTALSQVQELIRLYQLSDQKVNELFSVIAQISERWLPG